MEKNQIIIQDYLDFVGLKKPEEIRPFLNHRYKYGYWNVYCYSGELEKFLIENKIKHLVQ